MSFFSDLLHDVGGPIVNAFGSIIGASKQSDSAERAAKIQADAANQAAQLEATAAQNSLDFQKQQSALQQNNYLNTQQFNRGVYQDQQARLTPYRNLGTASIAQLGMPIPGGR